MIERVNILTDQVAPGLGTLKARAMAKMAEDGIGFAERQAMVERIALHMWKPAVYPISADLEAKIDAHFARLIARESEYYTEVADAEELAKVLAHESALSRLAMPLPDPLSDQSIIDTDAAERSSAQSIIDTATATTLSWVAQRDAARK